MKYIRIIALSLIFAVFMAFCASAESPDSGTVNTTALNYLGGVVRDLDHHDNYVIYRTGDYTTCLVFGRLDYKNNIFSGSDLTRVVYNQRGTSSGSNYTPTITYSSVANYSLTVSNTHLIYSDLGHFSALERSSNGYLFMILQIFVFFIFFWLGFNFVKKRWLIYD